jgi:DNA-binding XRE family transcriptional regulator
MISNKVKKMRVERGMSATELARRSKISRMTVSNIESFNVIPNLETALAISSVLEKDIGAIFFTLDVNRELQSGEK